MKTNTNRSTFQAVFLLAAFFLLGLSTYATHFRYGNVNWTILSTSGNSTVVEFTVTTSYYFGPLAGQTFQAWATVPIGGTINTQDDFIFGQGTNLTNLQYVVTSKNTSESWLVASKTFQHTYTSLANFNAFMTGAARVNTLLENNSNTSYYIRTVVSLLDRTNSPPSASTPPIFYVPINQLAYTIKINASDPDVGDVLTYSWPPVGSAGSGLNTPIPSIVAVPKTIINGNIILNTMNKAIGQQYSTQVWITDLDGARTAVDFVIQLVGQSNPPIFNYSTGFTPANGSVIKVQPGQTINFNVSASDVDPSSTVTLSEIGVPAGSTFLPAAATGNPVTRTFNWVTSFANLGSRTITFSAVDNFFVQTTTSVTLIVTLAPVFDVPPPCFGRTQRCSPRY